MTEQEINYFLKKSVDKNLQKVVDITFMWSMSNATIYEKAVLTQLILHKDVPMTSQEIAFNTGVSIASVRRAVKSFKQTGICINHPKVDGIILSDIAVW